MGVTSRVLGVTSRVFCARGTLLSRHLTLPLLLRMNAAVASPHFFLPTFQLVSFSQLARTTTADCCVPCRLSVPQRLRAYRSVHVACSITNDVPGICRAWIHTHSDECFLLCFFHIDRRLKGHHRRCRKVWDYTRTSAMPFFYSLQLQPPAGRVPYPPRGS